MNQTPEIVLTIILFTVVGVVFGYQVGIELDSSTGWFSFMFGAMGLMIGCMAALVAGLFLTSPEHFEEKTVSNRLVSLNSQISVSGNFFLGTGSVSGVKTYYYFVDTPKGVNSRSVSASNSYIVETDSVEPKIVKHNYQLSQPSSIWTSIYIPLAFISPTDYNRLYIPEGSIKHQYKPN